MPAKPLPVDALAHNDLGGDNALLVQLAHEANVAHHSLLRLDHFQLQLGLLHHQGQVKQPVSE